jgi:hypothetical protein
MTAHRKNLLLRWLTMTALSAAAFIGCYGCGKAIDCSPGQIDGQCGLGTGVGEISGIFVGAAIFISATIYYGSAALKRSRITTQPNKPGGDA